MDTPRDAFEDSCSMSAESQALPSAGVAKPADFSEECRKPHVSTPPICILSGPLNRLNAILSLLQPLDRYRAPLCDSERDWEALSRPISLPRPGKSSQPPRSKPLRRAQPCDSGAIVSQTPLKQVRNKNAIEAAILNRVLDRD